MVDVTQRHLEKIAVRDLLVGMYIARLDRPWAGTPFPVQGFHLESRDDIQILRVHCDHVFVDHRRSKISRQDKPADVDPRIVPLKIEYGVYDADYTPFKDELGKAQRTYRAMSGLMVDTMTQVQAGGDLAFLALHRLAWKMVDGICRNPDVYAWAATVYDQETYAYRNEVRAGIRAVIMGRNIGLERDRLLVLMLGCLLADIGKLRLPDELLESSETLDTEARDAIKQHVELGVELLSNTVGIDREVITIVGAHHERHNGSGYPNGLEKSDIPLLARISGIAGYYEAITNPRPYHEEQLSPSEAMAMLHELRGVEFQGQIVGEFIQAIGIYPTGSLVQLSNGDIAIVKERNVERRLKPIVMRILKPSGKYYVWRKVIDLEAEEEDSGSHTLEIAKSLSHGAYGVNSRALVRKPIFGF